MGIAINFNKKDVLSFASIDQAKEIMGQDCYFGNSLYDLDQAINKEVRGKLTEVVEDTDRAINIIFAGTNTETTKYPYQHFGLCLPCELVKEKEPKYRPFKTIEEFKSVVGEIGSVICFKPINCNAKYSVMFLGILDDEFGRTNVLIGGMPHDFAELFDEYVLLRNGKEVPFGIKMKSIKVEHEQD